MKRNKISIIGAGNIGGTTAYLCSIKELGDVVLVDVTEGIPQGKGLDISASTSIEHVDYKIRGTTQFEEIIDSDIVIITAGIPRKPGMTREDLLKINSDIVKGVSEKIKQYAPKAIVIVVSNPLDAMAFIAKKVTGFPRNRVIGMAGVLDSTRFAYFIAEELNVSVENVQAMMLGGHGDEMIPLVQYTNVAGIPIDHFLSKEKIDKIIERTRKGGIEIVELLKTGSAYYAPSSSIIEMLEAIFKDKKKIMPCSVYLEGEYGINGLCVGVPVKLGKDGVHEIIEIELNKDEKKMLELNENHIRELVNQIQL